MSSKGSGRGEVLPSAGGVGGFGVIFLSVTAPVSLRDLRGDANRALSGGFVAWCGGVAGLSRALTSLLTLC
ncbi:hypothetical protein GCM10020216_103860 [Nonomuraea helvata]